MELDTYYQKQISTFKKFIDIIISIFSKPSGIIGFSVLIMHIIIAIMSPLFGPYDWEPSGDAYKS